MVVDGRILAGSQAGQGNTPLPAGLRHLLSVGHGLVCYSDCLKRIVAAARRGRHHRPAGRLLRNDVYFYFCNYFVITFSNVAIIACASIRLQGGDPTVADGFRAAFSRIHVIFGWALVSATVGLILRIIEDRSEWVGRIVAGLLGMAWTAVSFLVIPVMVVENKSPLACLKESIRLLRKTWGEQLISNFSFGLVFFLLAIPAILVGAVGIFTLTTGSTLIGAICIALAIAYAIALSLVQSTLSCIFQTSLFFYARDEQLPAAAAFTQSSFNSAFSTRH